MDKTEIKENYRMFLNIEHMFPTTYLLERRIFNAKRRLIRFLFGLSMCEGRKYTKEVHQYVKSL